MVWRSGETSQSRIRRPRPVWDGANVLFGEVEEFMGQGQTVDAGRAAAVLGGRSVVLVGMMGAGKTSVGKRLAARLGLPFVDADAEIEAGAQLTITEIFERFGELYFREGERKVIARLLNGGPLVLATGGGAFMNPTTRQNIAKYGVSIRLTPSPISPSNRSMGPTTRSSTPSCGVSTRRPGGTSSRSRRRGAKWTCRSARAPIRS
jgi:shikimate kinase